MHLSVAGMKNIRSNSIRPETYIDKYIDESWRPLLQTPPFPEYTSGHSVISTASAVVLTKIFGDNFSFTDNTETEFNLPARHFNSFMMLLMKLQFQDFMAAYIIVLLL